MTPKSSEDTTSITLQAEGLITKTYLSKQCNLHLFVRVLSRQLIYMEVI